MKTERLYLRTTPDIKEYLQEVADSQFEGNISAVFDFMIERLGMHLEGDYNSELREDFETN